MKRTLSMAGCIAVALIALAAASNPLDEPPLPAGAAASREATH